jgi:hypothetical protein
VGVWTLDGGCLGSSATGQEEDSKAKATGASQVRRAARVGERDSGGRSGPPRPYPYPSSKHGRERERRCYFGPVPPLNLQDRHHRPRRRRSPPACADMGRRGSSDRLEALSLEIERKLQKVTTHRFAPRVRSLGSARRASARRARCSDFAAPVLVSYRLAEYSVNLCSSRLIRGSISLARMRSRRFARNSRAAGGL